MREIKFRAWDKEIKRMYPVYPNWFVNNEFNSEDFAKDARKDNIELLQFTGLKDKNGKEIYEGDLLKFVDEIEMPFAIEWRNGRFICSDDDELILEWLDLDRDYEVIGNIYENPELLK